MNFFEDIEPPKDGEIFQKLFESKDILIEKIISSNKQDGKLYNQNHDEWVMLVEGEAILELGDEKKSLKKGDFLLICKNTPHRVLQTKEGTLWFCVHMKS